MNKHLHFQENELQGVYWDNSLIEDPDKDGFLTLNEVVQAADRILNARKYEQNT